MAAWKERHKDNRRMWGAWVWFNLKVAGSSGFYTTVTTWTEIAASATISSSTWSRLKPPRPAKPQLAVLALLNTILILTIMGTWTSFKACSFSTGKSDFFDLFKLWLQHSLPLPASCPMLSLQKHVPTSWVTDSSSDFGKIIYLRQRESQKKCEKSSFWRPNPKTWRRGPNSG